MGNLKKVKIYKSITFKSDLICGFDTVEEKWTLQMHRKEGLITIQFNEKELYKETKKELIKNLKFQKNEK